MSASFDLVDREWIPCVLLDGSRQELGLLPTLVRAREIREVHDPSPLVTVALHRLLLAILHKNFGPESPEKWREFWRAWAFGQRELEDYFAKWRHRFDLFGTARPFYQDVSLPDDWMKPVSVLQHDLSGSSSSPLFTHDGSRPLLASAAARALVAQQAYALGGTVSREKGTKPGAQGGRLVPGAAVMLVGDDLFETLMLNMVRYSAADGEPSGFREAGDDAPPDAPAWESGLVTRYETRLCRGYLDYLTWQTRRIRLGNIVSEHASTRVWVCNAALTGGWEFSGSFRARDPVVAYRPNKSAAAGRRRDSGQNQPWVPWKPERRRVLWRDCNALLRSYQPAPDGGGSDRPAVVDWVAGLRTGRRVYSLDTYGVWHKPGQQVRIYFWRHERLPLPTDYLHDDFVVDALQACLKSAEDAASSIESAVRTLAREIEAPGKSDAELERPENRKLRDKVRSRANTHAAESVYWAALEVPFKELMLRLPAAVADRTSEEKEIPAWSRLVGERATEALDQTIRGLGLSSQNMRAAVRARGNLQEQLTRARR